MKPIAANVLTLAIAAACPAFAQNKDKDTSTQGNTPNGRPFTYLNEQIDANAQAISSLDGELQQLQGDLAQVNDELGAIDGIIALYTVQLAALQNDLDATRAELLAMKTAVDDEMTGIRQDIAALEQEIRSIESSVTTLTQELSLRLTELRSAVSDNAGGISGLLIDVSTLTADLLLMNAVIGANKDGIEQLEDNLEALGNLVGSLEQRLGALEQVVEEYHNDGLCFSFSNTDAEDLTHNDWFDHCVQAAQDGGETIRVLLKDAAGAVVYDASGSISGTWSATRITSTGDDWMHSRPLYHDRLVTLDTGDKLMIAGKLAANGGCAGSLGNGYGIAIYPSTPDYHRNIKLLVQPYKHQHPSYSVGMVRGFLNWSAGAEIAWRQGATFDTCAGISGSENNAPISGFQGVFEVYIQ